MLLPRIFSIAALFHVLVSRHRRSVPGPRVRSGKAATAPSKSPDPSPKPATDRFRSAVNLGGVRVDLLDAASALEAIAARAASAGAPALGVCSANLDHIRHFGVGGRWSGTLESPGVEWLTLIDGSPLASEALRLTGIPWPRLAGSDLVEPILEEAERRRLRVGFLGGSEQAHHMIKERFAVERPGLTVAGWWAPDREVVTDDDASRRLAADIAGSSVDILVVGLGKPRQELWIHQYGALTGAKVLLAFGAVVDFLAGHIKRAPAWVSGHGMEWAWRLMLEPRRLARRYLVDGPEAYWRLRRDSGTTGALDHRPLNGAPHESAAFSHSAGSFVPAREFADVAVIVVTYNNADDVGPLITSLRAETADQSMKVVVADNSPDGRTMAALAAFPDVIAHGTGGNLGYAGGINAALREAGPADSYLVLNPDLRVERGSVHALRRRMEACGAGVVVPVLLDDDGSVYPSLRREPALLRALGDAVCGSHFSGRPGWLSEMDYEPESYKHAHCVEWATGAALLIDAGTARVVGAWDEQFFLYSEETDYCHRVRGAGFSIWFEPTARMWHERGGSGTSAQLAALMAVNRVRYVQKHVGAGKAGLFRAAVVAGEVARLGLPGHREAMLALLNRRRWSSLPHATTRDSVHHVPAAGAVVIPAHNEAAVIGRTLESLRGVLRWGTVEVVVACNGCTDGTEEIAAGFAGVRVLRVGQASKTAALNTADEVVEGWPRLYLDADIEVSPEAVAAVFAALGGEGLLAARPAFRYDTAGASLPVRAYYRARLRIRGNSEALWGAGAYALSEAGHARLGKFPPLTGDDYYVDRLFSPAEKAVVGTVPVVVRTPRSVNGLMAVLRRTYRGNAEQDAHDGGASMRRTVRQLAASVRGPVSVLDAVVYAAFAGAGRRRAFFSGRPPVAWERDETSR
ncbi:MULTISPECIES: WecB/TagA/CpsF family glycosyltransferase [Paenarthrobacter]|uniref:WecB/TagA/CpsF family glycosyltransferase n=1 Tax=Paenarthrobacter TaxID=1742992 RepID=UPI0009E79C21|nr:WecB/TagA/CpsF family glycosyltransferase [Paenarthrobacter ureafaciens]RWW98967.1 WecB/TagA/CpsF family glycosyltransferase [Paenarthrobacter ureafaciens]